MNTKKQWIAMLLILAMLFAALPIAAFAEVEEQTSQENVAAVTDAEAEPLMVSEEEIPAGQTEAGVREANAGAQGSSEQATITVRWVVKNGRGYYNPYDADQNRKVPLDIVAKYVRKTDAGATQIHEEVIQNQATVGEADKDLSVPVMGTFDYEGTTYTDWQLEDAYISPVFNHPVLDKIPYLYTSVGTKTGNHFILEVHQQALLVTTMLVVGEKQVGPDGRPIWPEEGIVLDEDWKDLKVRITMERNMLKKNGTFWSKEEAEKKGIPQWGPQNPYKNAAQGDVIIEETHLFQKDKYHPFHFFETENNYETNQAGFYRALRDNAFELFSPDEEYQRSTRAAQGPSVDGKSAVYKMHAEWAPGDDARKAELDERYRIQAFGWGLQRAYTVQLFSRVKVEETTQDKAIPFETIYKDDPTMFVGESRIEQEGVEGKGKYNVSTYYLDQENGRKDIGEKDQLAETITPPTNRIVVRGTKTRPSTPSVPSAEYVDIIFDANEGAWANGETRREYRSAVGSTITIESAPMREGYKFLYWKGSEFHPGESYTVPAGGHTFVAQWEKVEKPEDKPSAPSVDPKIKTPRGSILTADEIAKILASTKRVIPAIPKAGIGR